MKYSEQQACFPTQNHKTGNNILALLFFMMGALHIYKIFRTRSTRALMTEKGTIVNNSGVNLYLKMILATAAIALIWKILVF